MRLHVPRGTAIGVFLLSSFLLRTEIRAYSQGSAAAPANASSAVQSDVPTDALPNAPLSAAESRAATSAAQSGPGSSPPDAQSTPIQTGSISGTVTDTNGDVVSGAIVVLEGPSVHESATSDGNGIFTFEGVKVGPSYHVTIRAIGFDDWVSSPIEVTPGEIAFVKDIRIRVSNAVTSVTVTSSTEQIATEQVAIEEKQRVFGIIPNFYVVYDSENAVPMTAKLKFKMALRVSVDPISFIGAGFLAGIDQASDNPDYPQGTKGYAERFGSVYTDGLTDTMFGGAILPSILHQDPRYYYKGTGTIRSRMLRAVEAPFICKGDNGKWQPNYSSMGGDLISASISTSYYPSDDRKASLVFENLLIDTAERAASTLIQEFVLRKWTPSARNKN